MRAVIAHHPGPPDVLQVVDLPDPEPAAGQVLVAVEVAAITFIDTQLRAGASPRPLAPDTFPLVLGNGVGGTVLALGDDVDPAWLDTQVVTSTGGRGGYATRALATASDLHRLPAAVDLPTAVALLADGRTALGLARAARIRSGDTVAVTAAAGGVGSLLVQLARNAGARVVALAGADRKLDHARSLGADTTINYRRPDWPEHLTAAAPDGLDVIFDGVGGPTSRHLVDHIAPGGRYLPHGAASGIWGDIDEDLVTARNATIIPLTEISSGPDDLYQLVEQALHHAARGAIRPAIGQTYPLDQAALAHTAIEARTALGKTLLTP
ncbi:zinc-binding dehydrogenase [Protofrankia symbiont of Coriaria ruscifolia]|uniref:Alcohol dehydrogenase zinc-binding domain protein n=1 Tax=Candidatus Protofrankia californiensis TaxID=1839754 RepID=A0A1C3NZF5_9ACTN|nr:zinc-binding dehydrogenase [Protofrankia symbiont of Coriaria ruscifolia]SBW22967.1 Alcohol dehydrogenase zinc-binding domain protein [Candidatus Protofrankia californiensis]